MAETNRAPALTEALPTDALKDAGQKLLGLLVQRAADAATAKVTGLSDRLTDVAENGGEGLGSVFGRDRRDGEGDGDDDGGSGWFGSAVGKLKDKIKNAFGGSGGGGKKLKVTNIVESIDVGLPLRTTYDLWTRFEDFPSFMKKVESVERTDSGEKSNWKAQVFWSHRTWEATVAEQVPDSHIVWQSKGGKGHVNGAVSFTELGRNLTRVLLVLEYWPQGLFERTGNLWRAQGRRARLEFKHFRRHAMTSVLLNGEEVEGWRGEIRDGEVVKTHEEAMAEEGRAEEAETESAGTESADESEGGEPVAEADEDRDSESEEDQAEEDQAEQDRAEEDRSEEDQPEEDEYDTEDEYADEDDYEDEDGDESDRLTEEDDYREDDQDDAYDDYEYDDAERDDIGESEETDEQEEAPSNGRARRRTPARMQRRR